MDVSNKNDLWGHISGGLNAILLCGNMWLPKNHHKKEFTSRGWQKLISRLCFGGLSLWEHFGLIASVSFT